MHFNMLVGRFYILNKNHNWTFLLHEFFFFSFFFARIFFLGIFPCMNFFFGFFPPPPPPHHCSNGPSLSSGLSNHKSSSTNRVEIRKPQHMLGTFLWCCAEIAENILARTKFKTRGIKHGQLSRFTVSIFYSSLL